MKTNNMIINKNKMHDNLIETPFRILNISLVFLFYKIKTKKKKTKTKMLASVKQVEKTPNFLRLYHQRRNRLHHVYYFLFLFFFLFFFGIAKTITTFIQTF